MKESQKKIKNIQADGVSGSNSVKVKLNGDYEMLKISLSNYAPCSTLLKFPSSEITART